MTSRRVERILPLFAILLAVLALTGRYLLYGVPHEYITGEYKATFEGDYDFTLELVRSFSEWGDIPLWSETYSGPIGIFASNFHVFTQALLYPLTHSLPLSIKILQVSQLLMAGLSMYALSNHLFRDRVAAAFSSVLYMFTPFYIGHLLSYLHYTGVYMLAPLVFYLILKTVRQGSFYHASALGLVTAYSLLMHPQNVFIGGLFYALFYLIVLTGSSVESLRQGELRIFLKRILPITGYTVLITGLLAAFIALPTLLYDYPYLRTSWVKGAGALVKVDDGHIGSHSQTLLSAVALQHWPWLNSPLRGGEYPHWAFMAVYLLPFALASVSVLIRLDFTAVTLISLTVLSVQISLGLNGRPDLFELAARYIPMFGMSRTPYTYINFAILSFSALSAVTFLWISERLTALRPALSATKARWAVFFAFALPYAFAAHYYGNSYNWTFISAKEPGYLQQVRGWLDENNTDRGRVIETCGIPTAMLLGSRMLPNEVDLLERFQVKEYLADYMALLGFSHVITPRLHSLRKLTFDVPGYMPPDVFDRGASLEEYYSALTTDYYATYERLKHDGSFRQNNAETRDVAIFENMKAFGGWQAYAARPVMVLGGTGAYDLLGIEGFKDSPLKPAPLFIAQDTNLKRLGEIKGASKELILHNTDSLDLFALLRKKDVTIKEPVPTQPADWRLAMESYGIQQPFPYHDHSIGNSFSGEMSFSNHAIAAERKGSAAVVYFDAKRDGTYRIMLRAFGEDGASRLAVTVDGIERGIMGLSEHRGFAWMTVWEGALEKGGHSVEVALADEAPAHLDAFMIAPPNIIEAGSAMTGDVFAGHKVIYLMDSGRFKEADGVYSALLRVASHGPFSPAALFSSGSEGEAEVFIDGRSAGTAKIEKGKNEYRFNEVGIPAGLHKVEMRTSNGLRPRLVSLSTGTGRGLPAGNINHKKTGPAEFEVSFSGSPGFFVFNETNYPGWRMEADGKEFEPVVSNMFMNGFFVPPGVKSAVVRYSNTGQKAGLIVSGATLVCVLAYLIIGAFSIGRGRKTEN